MASDSQGGPWVELHELARERGVKSQVFWQGVKDLLLEWRRDGDGAVMVRRDQAGTYALRALAEQPAREVEAPLLVAEAEAEIGMAPGTLRKWWEENGNGYPGDPPERVGGAWRFLRAHRVWVEARIKQQADVAALMARLTPAPKPMLWGQPEGFTVGNEYGQVSFIGRRGELDDAEDIIFGASEDWAEFDDWAVGKWRKIIAGLVGDCESRDILAALKSSWLVEARDTSVIVVFSAIGTAAAFKEHFAPRLDAHCSGLIVCFEQWACDGKVGVLAVDDCIQRSRAPLTTPASLA